MKVLVTGGAGYIGSHACKALAAAGFVPVAFDDLSTGHRDFVRWGDLFEGDVRSRESIRRAMSLFRPDAVMHFAALSEVGRSATRPDLYWETNVGGTRNLLDVMREFDVGDLVFSSTCAIYGNPVRDAIDESHPRSPVSAYGRTKAAMEDMIADYGRAFGIRHVALRYFNAAGAGWQDGIGERHDPETHLVPRVIASALGRGDPLVIMGSDYDTPDGTAIRDYIHVEDLARAHVAALLHMSVRGESGAFNLGTGTGSSVLDVIRAVEEVSGRKVTYRVGERREGDPERLVCDVGASRDVLRFRPSMSSIRQIVADAFAWHEAEFARSSQT